MRVCHHCGAQLYPLADLARLARQLGTRADEACQALDHMRLALPGLVRIALHESRLDAPQLARRLDCLAGTCQPPEAK